MMRRNTPKRAREDRSNIEARSDFAREFPACWICGRDYFVHTHEIASGPARRWAHGNRIAWLRVCAYCHDEHIHQGWHCPEHIAREYALKRICDQEYYDRPALNVGRFLAPDAVSADDVRAADKYVREFRERCKRNRERLAS